MTIQKSLHHLVPMKDAGFRKLVVLIERSITKKNISQVKEKDCGLTQPSFWKKLRPR